MPKEFFEYLAKLSSIIPMHTVMRQTILDSVFGPKPVDVNDWTADWPKI